MKITKERLKEIIKEELQNVLDEDKNMPKARIRKDIENDGKELPKDKDGNIDWKKADQMAADIRLAKPETRLTNESYGDMNDPYNPDAEPDMVQREMGDTGINCRDLPPSPGGRYDEMTVQQLLGVMCRPSHWKVYYHAQSELRKRGYTGPFPKLLPPNQRDY